MTPTQNSNVPSLRFKRNDGTEFPDWKETQLGEVFSWITTNSFSRERLTLEGGYVQNIHYGDIHKNFSANFRQSEEVVPYVRDATPDDFKSELFCQLGDIVIADASEDAADIGKAIEIVELTDIPLVAGLHTYIARPCKRSLHTGFSGYLLRSVPMRKQIERIAQGISVLGISKRNLERLSFNLPTPTEQRKIANFLSAVDTKIAQLSERQRLLEEYKKGCMQQLFSLETRFKDEHGNDFPDWEEKRLAEVGHTFGGLNGKSAGDFGTGSRFVTYMQVFKASQIYPEQCGFVQIAEGERQHQIQRGDIIFTTSSETPTEVGFASVVTVEIPDTYLNSFCFALRPDNTEELVPEFARYLFQSEVYRAKVIPLAQGSTRYNLSKISFLKLKLHIPHPTEQRKIADFLSTIDSKIELVAEEYRQAKAFKKGLLQQMFI